MRRPLTAWRQRGSIGRRRRRSRGRRGGSGRRSGAGRDVVDDFVRLSLGAPARCCRCCPELSELPNCRCRSCHPRLSPPELILPDCHCRSRHFQSCCYRSCHLELSLPELSLPSCRRCCCCPTCCRQAQRSQRSRRLTTADVGSDPWLVTCRSRTTRRAASGRHGRHNHEQSHCTMVHIYS